MSLLRFIYPTSLTFRGRDEVAPHTYTFRFTPDTPLRWHAGQHGMLEVKSSKGRTLRHMFSLSSAPSEGVISITTRYSGQSASEYKKALWALKPGDKAKLRGPVGPMYVRDPKQYNVFIASGIGITPFRSILVEASSLKQDLHGVLLYENHTQAVIFKDEIKAVSTALENFEVKLLAKSEELTEETLRLVLTDISSSMFYLAGSPSTIRRYKRLLKQLGVTRSHIKNDPFYGYK